MIKNNLEKKWAICLGGSASKIPILRSIKARGINCCVVDRNPNCACKYYADLFLNISTFDYDCIIEQLKKSKIKDDVVILFAYTSLMQAQFSASRISEKLNIPGWSESILKFAWDKIAFKNLCRKIGILTPESIISNNIDEIKHFIRKKGRVVYKPRIGGVGSESVHFIDSSTNLNSTIYKDKLFFLEEYLGNELYSLDGLVVDHKIIFNLLTKKIMRSGSRIIAGFISCLNKWDYLTIQAEKLIKAMRLDNTFFSFDIILHNGSFYFIDFGLLLDCEIDRLLAYADIDVFGLFIDYILKLTPVEKLKFNRKVAMAFLYPYKDGIIKKLPNLKDITLDPNIWVEFNKNENDRCEQKGLVSDKIGHVIRENICWRDLQKIANQFEEKIIIE